MVAGTVSERRFVVRPRPSRSASRSLSDSRAARNVVARVCLIDGEARDAHVAAMDAVRKPMREPYRR